MPKFLLINLIIVFLAATSQASDCAHLMGKGLELDRIAGRLEIVPQAESLAIVKFDTYTGVAAAKTSFGGDNLVNTLSPHYDPDSPTSIRVEEKAVVTQQSLNQFLSHSQSQRFADELSLRTKVVWASRDVPPVGRSFLTLTEYGSALTFNFESSNSVFVLKPRFRKYYSFVSSNKGADTRRLDPVMGDLVAFELKLTSISGGDEESFLGLEDTVFKPRIMINDVLADRLKSLEGEINHRYTELKAIEEEVLLLTNAENQAINDKAKVRSFFAALNQIIQQQPDFLKPVFAVSYERDSYSSEIEGRSYQFTADKDIRIYLADKGLSTAQLPQYHAAIPSSRTEPGEIFVELKSPVRAKESGSAVYAKLLEDMSIGHIESYKLGSGKYGIAKHLDTGVMDGHLDQMLFEQGTEFWTIKGASRLNSLLKKNEVVDRKVIQLAVPVLVGERQFKMQFTYGPAPKDNLGYATLKSIKLFNERAKELSIEGDMRGVIDGVQGLDPKHILAIDVMGQVIPFKTTLAPDEAAFYKEFFKLYYEEGTYFWGAPRELYKDFYQVDTKKGMDAYVKRLERSNELLFQRDRAKKVISGGLMMFFAFMGADIAMDTIDEAMKEPPAVIQRPVEDEGSN